MDLRYQESGHCRMKPLKRYGGRKKIISVTVKIRGHGLAAIDEAVATGVRKVNARLAANLRGKPKVAKRLIKIMREAQRP